MKLLILIFLEKLILISSNDDPRCVIENQDKNDCAPELKGDPEISTKCVARGCCYEEVGNNDNNIPWCYTKLIIPTTIPSTIISTIITTVPTTIPIPIYTTIPTIMPTLIPTTIPKLDCDEKCFTCSQESLKYHLCLSCKEGYKRVNYTTKYPKFYDCLEKNSPILKNFYYNNITQEYRPCYKTCETCEEDGNEEFHNCLKCKKNFRFRPDKSPEKNCVVNCTYYYLSPYGEYKCLENFICPEESKLMVIEKNACIDDCKKDDKYKYQYNGVCCEQCPEGTLADDNKICIEQDITICTLGTNKGYFNSNDDLSKIKVLVKSYIEEFNYKNNHISLYTNDVFKILIYKNSECFTKLNLYIPSVDFNDCYDKVKSYYSINEDLVIVIVEKLGQNNPYTLYSFYHPISSQKLDAEKICQNISITVKENLYSLLDETSPNYNNLISLTDQKINIFDLSDSFYTDLCYDYESPYDKDVPLADRIKVFYPNVTLCDSGCTNKGINLDDMTSICDCSFVDVEKSNIVKDNVILDNLFGDALDFINESNILVLKCYKYIFKYFTRSIGGWICLIILIGEVFLTIIFYLFELGKLQIYVFNLTGSYLDFLGKTKRRSSIHLDLDLAPPKKKVKFSKEVEDKIKIKKTHKHKFKKENEIKILRFNSQYRIKDKKEKIDKSALKDSKASFLKEKKKVSSKELFITRESSKKEDKKSSRIKSRSQIKKSDPDNISMDKAFHINTKDAKFFKEYLSTPLGELEYDDAIIEDKRKFCKCFYEILKERQMVAYTFIAEDPLKTRCTKIMLMGLNIVLYFVINGLFISEDYISDLFNSTEEEKFFSFFPRSIKRLFFSTFISVIISYITDIFFLEEKKIIGIYKREKDNKTILKERIRHIVKEIKRRYLAFIIFIFIILLISFYYLLCFNYVYPHTQIEWVKSSIVILIIMQILSFLSCLFEAGLRIGSFKCNSEKMYKISKFLSN